MISIRRMMQTDIPDCKGIVRSHWGDKIAEQAHREMAEMFSATRWPPEYFVAEDNYRITGFAGYKSSWMFSNTYELIWINVRKDMIGKGIGKLLTEVRLADIKDLDGRLVLLMTQKPGFFTQFEFTTIKTYNDDWCLMERQLGPLELDDRI